MDGGDSPSTVQSRKSKEVEDASPLGGGEGVKINLSHACETKWKGLYSCRGPGCSSAG